MQKLFSTTCSMCRIPSSNYVDFNPHDAGGKFG